MVKKVKEKKKLEKGGFSWKNFSLSGRISSILGYRTKRVDGNRSTAR